MLNHRNYAAPNVRKSGDPLFPDETAKPFEKPYAVGDYEEPIVVKDGFALPEYENQMEDEDYRFEIDTILP